MERLLMKNGRRLKVAVIGAGARGMYSYGEFFRQHPEKAEVVAVAEPRDCFRNEMVRRHNITLREISKHLVQKHRISNFLPIWNFGSSRNM